jgi:hypothetical protein
MELQTPLTKTVTDLQDGELSITMVALRDDVQELTPVRPRFGGQNGDALLKDLS